MPGLAMTTATTQLLDPFDWQAYTPDDVATLMFIIRGGEVLLIRKLRGLGAGKINAPGGRVEPGETLEAAAIRETVEEVGVRPLSPRLRGCLRFVFVDGYRLEAHVFTADACEGEARRSDEAIPLWTPLSAIPYGEMWADDAIWIPAMLAGRAPFSGRFVFDGDAMRAHALDAHDPAEALFARLTALGIDTTTVAHPPVFTVEEARAVRAHAPALTAGLHTKNLFVRNKKGRMWLFTLPEDRAVDLAALAEAVGTRHFSFASPDRLRRHLGVEPGSVTPLAALHDAGGDVTVVLDAALATAPLVQCHPLTNDRTTAIAGPDLVRFLDAVGHSPVIL
jgi:8-oxo-dGTP pyrophosphatase MutT (NUDIX family)